MNISPGKPPSRFKCTSSGRISAALYIFIYLDIRVSILFSIWHAHRVIKQAYWTYISRICAQMHVKGRAYICRGITLPTPICALAPAESPTYYYYWKWLIRASLLASLAFFLSLSGCMTHSLNRHEGIEKSVLILSYKVLPGITSKQSSSRGRNKTLL